MSSTHFAGLVALALALAGPAKAADPAPAAAPAAAEPASPGVEAAAALLKLYSPNAKVGRNKNFAYINLVTASPRTQQVFISGNVFGPSYAKVREVISNAYKFTGAMDATLGQRLLADNEDSLPKGAWVVQNASDGSHMVAFESYIPLDAGAVAVQEAVNYAAEKTDKLEAELTPGKDDY